MFKETRDSRYIYRNELDKPCCQHMAFKDFKDLSRRTAADKVLKDKAFNMDKDAKYDGYQRGFASMAYKFFDIKTLGSCIKSMPNLYFINPLLENPKKQKYFQHSRTIFVVLI